MGLLKDGGLRLIGTEAECGLKWRHEFGAKIDFSGRKISAHNYT